MNLVLKALEESDLKDRTRKHQILHGIQYIVKFDNGYGASIIKHPYSYGAESDLWELAVLKRSNHYIHNGEYRLCYDSGITDDVLGNLTDEDVMEYLEQIENL